MNDIPKAGDPVPAARAPGRSAPGKSESRVEGHAESVDLSEPAKENLAVVANFLEQEDARISGMQLVIERISNFFGSPTYFVFAIVFMMLWIALNTFGTFAGWEHVDEPPFFWLQGIVSANALLLTIAVLIRQNRMSRLAQHHSHLDLQINLLSEQKVTKILNLLENGEVDIRIQAGRDPELTELTKPADPEAILNAIKKQHDSR